MKSRAGRLGSAWCALLVAAAAVTPAAAAAPVSRARPATHQRPVAPLPTEVVPEAKSYLLVDLGTGNVLAGYHERLRLPPASLTKVLTALIAVSYLGPHATVAGTKQSLAAYPDTVGIERGVPWPVEDVLQSLLVMSANDAAYALAQKISGSLAAFGTVMDRSAAQIGMSDDPVFHDPAGLDGNEGVDGGNLVSARDLAIAGRDLLRVPRLAQIVKETSYRFVDPTGQVHYLATTNYTFLVSEPGAIGVKTGFTDRAGSCVMGAATQHGRTMLAVVMNGYNPAQTAIDLLDQGFATPVDHEPTTDRLPPFALPEPPAAHAQGLGRDPAHKGKTDPAPVRGRPNSSHHDGAQPTSRPSTRGASTRAPATRGPATRGPAARGAATRATTRGLAAVAGSMPGTLLILGAATALVVALAEYLKLGRLRRAQQLAPRPPGRTTAWVTTLGGSRRHRSELVASYSRHERQPGWSSRPG